MIFNIKLIVGLGNPGDTYKNTRHNTGFRIIDLIADKLHAMFYLEKKIHGHVAKIYNKRQFFLLKPNSYMNNSGFSVNKFLLFYKLLPEEILVIHDDIDLMPGIIKFKIGGSNAGHNGLKSIQQSIKSANFWRARIGVGHPKTLNLKQSVADFVLHNLSLEEIEYLYNFEKLYSSNICNIIDGII
ncbi:Peptidyl-tRNA hydrolase [Candidatus Kinetoplastibacterium sorsogonicusi]|uniref:Peptidyl-tRNA hydrolase n=1 Tax=Candidatus Kinetoplastidibacterium kentomonadis TaxID=1576550 RepID=A0A3Q8ER23_9PROT|nr:aminoacyl-tRNA hydrolase [Candidatus Kinetoplastibacterium sorsogonicusi]AWD32242.1 Peptidyl-tRNA hydrolase [Candidatus Kinetoplastibacterium sorsogonicusi]